MSIDQPLRCPFCSGRDGNHIGYCTIVGSITGYNVLAHYVADEENNAPESEQTLATGPDSY